MRFSSVTDRVADMGSDKWAVHFAARRMKAAGEPVIELTIGEPDVPPDPALLQICTNAMHSGRTRYAPGAGEPAAREAIAAKYARRTGRPITPANVLTFAGTQNALFTTMTALVETGDAVLVGDPIYATYEGVIRATGATPITVPLRRENGYHLQAEDVAARVTDRCRAILINTPHNPTGAVLTADEIAAIGRVASAHDLWLVSDEVYEELTFNVPFASPFDEGELAERTVVVSSISKSHAAPGFRSGWAVGPEDFVRRAQPLSEVMLFGIQPFIADMTAAALAGPSKAAKVMRDAYQRRGQIVINALENCPLTPMAAEAGMFTLIDVSRTGLSGAEFALGLLQSEGVAVMPGNAFGTEAAGAVRVSLTVDDERLAEACARMARHAISLRRTDRYEASQAAE